MYEITTLLASLFIALVAAPPVTKPGAATCMDRVFAADNKGGFAISQDAGETWAVSYPVSTGHRFYSIYAVGDNVYGGTDVGAAVSNDGGQTWTIQQLNPFGEQWEQDTPSVFAMDKRVWAGVFYSGSVCISDDNGQTWPIDSRLPDANADIRAVYAAGNKTFVGTYFHGLGISDDDGKTWHYTDHTQGLASDSVTAIAGDGDNVYAGSRGGWGSISISQDGGKTWRAQNTMQTASTVYSVSAVDGKVYVGTNAHGVSISEDGGQSWIVRTRADGLTSNTIHSVAAAGNNVYAATVNGLSISRDGGQTWTAKDIGTGSKFLYAVFAQCL